MLNCPHHNDTSGAGITESIVMLVPNAEALAQHVHGNHVGRHFGIEALTLVYGSGMILIPSKRPQPGRKGGGRRQERTDSPAEMGRAARGGPNRRGGPAQAVAVRCDGTTGPRRPPPTRPRPTRSARNASLGAPAPSADGAAAAPSAVRDRNPHGPRRHGLAPRQRRIARSCGIARDAQQSAFCLSLESAARTPARSYSRSGKSRTVAAPLSRAVR